MSKTSEYVTLGHPDKVADYISEYCLDRIIEQDPFARYALEVQVKDNIITYGGEVTTSATLKMRKWVKEAVAAIGYTHEYAKAFKFQTLDASNLKIKGHISLQSRDIKQGVDAQGWGDQGIFFGMHSWETVTGDGWDYYLAKKLGQSLYYSFKDLDTVIFGLDIKTQVTVDGEENGCPIVKQVVVAVPMVKNTEADRNYIKGIVDDFLAYHIAIKAKDYECIVNGTGAYFTHASVGDCGTTGRKLVVDFYGSNCRIGGGSPWTKDGTKADLTLNLYAKDLAKSIYNEREKDKRCAKVETELSCCIGQSKVRAVIKLLDEHGNVYETWEEYKDILPKDLIEKYKLRQPIYAEMCEKGLFYFIQ